MPPSRRIIRWAPGGIPLGHPALLVAAIAVLALPVPMTAVHGLGLVPPGPAKAPATLASGGATAPSTPLAMPAIHESPSRTLSQGPRVAPSASPTPPQGVWSQVNNSTFTPPTSQSGGMIYDPIADEFVLFGGYSGGGPVNDTWVFKDGNWTDLGATLSVAPSPRWYFSFVWDGADQYGLLFGGRNDTVDLNDTWSFNGSNWSRVVTSSSPPPLTSGRTVYDAADGYVWLYGGYSIMPHLPAEYNFTWTYAAGTWTNRTANVTGAPSDPHVVTYAVYDSSDGYVLLYGGSAYGNASCGLAGNTWTYLNGTYHDLTSSLLGAPPVSLGSRMMANDPTIGGVVLYGGWDGGLCPYSNQTWVYRGGVWYNQSLGYNPGPLWDGEMAEGGSSATVLLFSGAVAPGTALQSLETWNYTPALTASVAGPSPHEGVVPFTVNLTSTVEGIGPFTYRWNWGDGSSANTTANASHTYVSVGTYRAKLAVTDSLGKVVLAPATIEVFSELTPNASVAPGSGEAPLVDAFTSGRLGGVPPIVAAWAFGDGTGAAGMDANHTFVSAGNYTWWFNVTDAQGHTASTNGSVRVWPTLVAPKIQLNQTEGLVPLAVNFTAAPAGGRAPYSFLWTFGDGASSLQPGEVTHVYQRAGNYTGSVAVTDYYDHRVVVNFTVAVADPLTGLAQATPTVGVAPAVVHFTGTASNGFAPYNFSWNLGTAAATAVGPDPTFTYPEPGNYSALLRITDSDGHSFTSQLSITVVAPLALNLTGTPRATVTDTPVNFRPGPIGGEGPFAFSWVFGDGSTVTGPENTSHSYLTPGLFLASVTVTDQLDEVQHASLNVEVGAPLTITVSANLTTLSLGDSVGLQVTTSGGLAPLTASWTGLPPGCTPTSHLLQFSCTPSNVGTFHIDVWVNDSAGQSRLANTTVAVTALPSGTSGSSSTPWPELLLGAGAIAVIGGTVGWALRRRRSPPASLEGTELPPEPEFESG